MTISFTPDQEGQDALDARVLEFNTKQGASLSNADFLLQQVVEPFVASLKRSKFDAAVNRLGQLVASMTYSERLELIAYIEAEAA